MVNRFLIAASLVGSMFLIGCGGERLITVTGTVLRDGKPLPVSRTGVVQVTLVPDVQPGEPYTTHVGRCDSEGKFEIPEVPVGTYKIAIELLDPTPQVDKLGGAFSQNTKFKRQLEGKEPLQIDLAKPDA